MARTIAALLAVLALAAGGCGGDDENGASPEQPTAAETAQGDAEAGADVFASAGCGGCHTLEAAGSSGATGPNLDELAPDHDTVVRQVTNGGGGMPAFGDSLSDEQIQDVAAFVVESTH